MKKKILAILFNMILIIGLTGCENKLNQVNSNETQDKNTYIINIPNLNSIISITIDTLSQTNNVKEFNDNETIENIYNIFSNKNTNIESVNDNPLNPEILYLITFKDNETKSTSVYIYKRNSKYYIEQPYNGIYEISENDFNIIEKYIK